MEPEGFWGIPYIPTHAWDVYIQLAVLLIFSRAEDILPQMKASQYNENKDVLDLGSMGMGGEEKLGVPDGRRAEVEMGRECIKAGTQWIQRIR